MKFQTADCICIFGKRKSGKSYLARKINEIYPRQVIIDPVADWTDGEIVSSFRGFANKLREKLKTGAKKYKIIFRFSPDEKNTPEIFNEILRLCYYAGDLQVVIDEVQMFCNPHWMPPWLKNLAFIGRHQKVGLCNITQRPAQINKGLLSQAEHIFCGQLHDKNDLRAVADFIGDDTDQLINLPARNFIYFSPTYGKKRISTENNSEK
ncbi:hypothetical protein AZI87_12010 [Bdellovibrio bacteriovorus]|uniref:ORC1/DEAH AAA+ ATPase domain-containing protein n=1 Tax=Bdellovibrio bacteriovorus TaxID=959 RepID=A0A162G8E4_BDEBC|nr:AAA family ATPase [Bdellovibrio bacteriovorus]KYG65273.1 hypothetical protein AZI87_12010 [Bdellovibrio bacteriovorus]